MEEYIIEENTKLREEIKEKDKIIDLMAEHLICYGVFDGSLEEVRQFFINEVKENK